MKDHRPKPPSKPEDIPRQFAECWNRRDAHGLAALFDEDADFVNVVGLWWHNRQDIFKAHDYGLRRIFNNSTLELRRTEIRWLADAVAVVHAKFRLTGQTPLASRQPTVRNTIFSFVVHDQGSGWSCASAQNTEIIPGKETFLVDEDGGTQAVDYRAGSADSDPDAKSG